MFSKRNCQRKLWPNLFNFLLVKSFEVPEKCMKNQIAISDIYLAVLNCYCITHIYHVLLKLTNKNGNYCIARKIIVCRIL